MQTSGVWTPICDWGNKRRYSSDNNNNNNNDHDNENKYLIMIITITIIIRLNKKWYKGFLRVLVLFECYYDY